MAVRKFGMGDPRLQGRRYRHRLWLIGITGLIDDIKPDTMRATGAWMAALQIGVSLQVVIFGFERQRSVTPRYPRAADGADQFRSCRWATPKRLAGKVALGAWAAGRCGARSHCYSGLIRWRANEREVSVFHARGSATRVTTWSGVFYPMRVRDFRCFGWATRRPVSNRTKNPRTSIICGPPENGQSRAVARHSADSARWSLDSKRLGGEGEIQGLWHPLPVSNSGRAACGGVSKMPPPLFSTTMMAFSPWLLARRHVVLAGEVADEGQ